MEKKRKLTKNHNTILQKIFEQINTNKILKFNAIVIMSNFNAPITNAKLKNTIIINTNNGTIQNK